jgi:hypothetical protein
MGGNAGVDACAARAVYTSILCPSLRLLSILAPSSCMRLKMAPRGRGNSRAAACGLWDADVPTHGAVEEGNPVPDSGDILQRIHAFPARSRSRARGGSARCRGQQTYVHH